MDVGNNLALLFFLRVREYVDTWGLVIIKQLVLPQHWNKSQTSTDWI